MPAPYDPIKGSDNPLYGPFKPYTRFVYLEDLTVTDESVTAQISTSHQWGPGLYHTPEVIVHVHNLLSPVADLYVFSANTGDVGMGLWDRDNHWRIIGSGTTAIPWYIGKVSDGAIASDSTGEVTQYTQLWQITNPAVTFTVLNPHDFDIPDGWEVRWTKYPGWTDWVVEPWKFGPCT